MTTTKSALLTTNTDSDAWSNPYGGYWGTATNWIDTTPGAATVSVPGVTNAVTIAGGSAAFTNILGTGAAAQLSVGLDVLLWGSVAVAGSVAVINSSNSIADFELDGGAALSAASLAIAAGSTLEVGNASKLAVAGLTTLNGGFIGATNGSVVQLGSLIANTSMTGGEFGYGVSPEIAVDDNSSLEIGTAGSAAAGAVTVDKGASFAASGSIDGNLVLKGVLGVEAGGDLSIDTSDLFGAAGTISGTGTLTLSENSDVDLGVADSAAIAFTGPGGVLYLDVIPTGTISGFGASDSLLTGTLATGLSAKQSSTGTETLTLTKGAKTVGTLTLAGNYTGDLFHLSVNAYGSGTITLQTIGSPPVQPSLIQGTPGYDSLVATANNQILTGLGGNDILSGGSFTGVDFEANSGDLNGCTINDFVASDVIDLTDVKLSAASVTYKPGSLTIYPTTTPAAGTLTVTDGTHAATVDISFNGATPTGLFSVSSDGASGTDVRFTTLTLSATANNQTLSSQGAFSGSNDDLGGNGCTGIDFKDPSTSLNHATITGFVASDVIDLTDVKAASASLTYSPGNPGTIYPPNPGTLTVTDGTHSATIDISVSGTLPIGYFSIGTDGASGTDLKYITANTDADTFSNVLGGAFASAGNWKDTTTAATATLVPSYGNAVTINGGIAGFTDITGNGAAASLTTGADLLLLGTVTIGSLVSGVSGALNQTGTLALDGGASLSAAGTASIGGALKIGGGSKLTAGALEFAASTAGSVLAYGGSSAQFGTLVAVSSMMNGTIYEPAVIGVDLTSCIEIGTVGGARTGALTIDTGVTATLGGGAIEGNVVLNGTLAIVSGTLAIGSFGTASSSVSGAGAIDLYGGATLILSGSDSAAIVFNGTVGAPAYTMSGTAETLALGATLPTGTIAGFTQGDIITLAKTVTGLSYAQKGTGGVLTLLNAGISVGTLALTGTYSASQFQLESVTGGQSSIFYVSAPSTAPGGQVSSNSDAYSWANTSGGNWSNAGNWSDTTKGTIPTTAPGTGNAVTISGAPATDPQIISGSGSAATLFVGTATVFTGDVTVAGQLEIEAYSNNGSFTGLSGGANVTAASLNNTTAVQIAGSSALTILGSPTATSAIQGNLSIIGGSAVRINANTDTPYIYNAVVSVDGTSSMEIGFAGTAAVGALSIGTGQALDLGNSGYNGNATVGTIAANVVLNGTLMVSQGLIEGYGGSVGSISGTGTIEFASVMSGGANLLVLSAADTASIAFGNFSSLLELAGPLPSGTISGLIAGNSIKVDQTVTGVSFKQTTATQGTLTLTDGTTTVGTLTLAGSYATSLFHLDVSAASGYGTISLQTAPAAAGTGTAGTSTDAYSWTGASGGAWSTAANWKDATTGKAATAVAGSGDAVTITGSTVGNSIATTVGGNGVAASLAIGGDVLLTGTVSATGVLAVAPVATIGELDLDSKAKLTAGSATISGTLQAGGGSSATVSAAATLSGGTLLAVDGSTVQLGSLIANTSNDAIAVDANSVIKVGSPATAAAGAITQAAGTTAALSGSIYGNIAAGGTIAVIGGGSLFIDLTGVAATDPYGSSPAISGAGVLSITEGSTLGLGAADSTAIQFAGPDSTLVLAKVPTGTISGFAIGDQIQLDQPVTAVSYKQVTASAGALTLGNGSTTVGTLTLSGTYAAGAFHLDDGVRGSTAVISLQSLGIAITQPALIQGTAGADLLVATANNQTMTGNGGGDTLNGGTSTGLDFKDLTANLNGSALQNFAMSDVIDFTDLTFAKASDTFSAGVLSVTDTTHTAKLSLGFAVTPTTGSFHLASDGSTGTRLTWS